MEDRRRGSRAVSKLQVRLRLEDAVLGPVLGRDVATGGLGIEANSADCRRCDHIIGWRGPVDVEVELPSGSTVHAKADTVWWHLDVAGEAWRYRAGLRFLQMASRDQKTLRRFVDVELRQQA